MMRKFILIALMAATALPASGAIAQTRELQRDRQEIREQRQDVRQAQRYGNRNDVREERRDLREARQEHREDWRDYRKSNGKIFRQGRYIAPRGYAYRPVRVGGNINRAFYNQRYWIADPYRYRLPVVRGSQRWVRYGNDVLLLDTRNGRVLQIYNGFFW